jgi:hypothetical protein
VYTYGSPRVGDVNFTKFISDQSGETLRVTNREDPVTVVPPITFLGYAHTSPEYWFPNKPESPEDYRVCVGEKNTKCSGQFLFKPWLIGTQHSVKFYDGNLDPCPGNSMETEVLDTSSLTLEDIEKLSKALRPDYA